MLILRQTGIYPGFKPAGQGAAALSAWLEEGEAQKSTKALAAVGQGGIMVRVKLLRSPLIQCVAHFFCGRCENKTIYHRRKKKKDKRE